MFFSFNSLETVAMLGYFIYSCIQESRFIFLSFHDFMPPVSLSMTSPTSNAAGCPAGYDVVTGTGTGTVMKGFLNIQSLRQTSILDAHS